MARTISTALQAEFDKSVTRVGYLLELNTSPTLRWCDVGQVTWQGNTYVPFDFDVSGVGSGVSKTARLEIQNLDSAVAAILLGAQASALICDLWQVAPSATGNADVVRLGKFLFADMEIKLDKLQARLISQSSIDAFSPRRRVDPYNGFNYALPEGAVIAWENDLYIVGMDRA